MQTLIETLDEFAPLRESRDRKVSYTAWLNKGLKNLIS